MKILSRLLPLALFAPLFAFAAPGAMEGVSDFFSRITLFMNNTLVPAIFALAFLVFLWGMFKTFILGGHDEEKQGEGKQLMMYAIAGFVIMVSLWGIVNLLANGLGFTKQDAQFRNNLPVLPIPQR